MIRLELPPAGLPPAERFSLDLLVDLSRVVPVDDASADVVRLEVTEDHGHEAPTIAANVRSDWFIRSGVGTVTVPRGALRRIAEIASAAREQESTTRDRFGRVPSTENELVAEGLEREPVVSRAAVAVRAAVVAAAGRRPLRLAAPWPDGKRWAAAFTHDLDVVAMWPLFTGLRLVELLRKGETALVLRVLRAAGGAIGRNPVWAAVADLLRRESAHGIRSTWFILCGTPTSRTITAGDLTYRPESEAARRIIAAIAGTHGEIGLHGSFETQESDRQFAAQRTRLEGLVGTPVTGVRQHFLRTRPGSTHQAMALAGFEYDSTSGYPDRNGFRLGVADIIPLWNARTVAPVGLEEAPFCWMDRALSKYRGVEDPAAWVSDAMELAGRCREVNGLWVGVWHPNLVPALGFPGAPGAFAQLAQAIMQGAPFTAPLGEIVAWRRARRSIRVRGVSSDGTVDAYAARHAAWPLGLEAADGSAMETARTTS